MWKIIVFIVLNQFLLINTHNIVHSVNKDDLHELNVIHINDFHARFDETNPSSGSCRENDECIGGLARMATAIKQLKRNKPDSLLLNAGDNFQGTIWYNIFKWNVTQHFLNLLNFDAYTLGNHEFDDKIAGVVPFIKHLKSPVVLSNMNDTLEPRIQGLYNKSIVIERGGKRIGIIGVIISTVNEISSTEKLKFMDEIDSINKEAKRLVDEEGVFTNIVISHSGYERELNIAAHVGPKVSLIVGGHSHSLLYNGTAPNGGLVTGPYPTVVGSEDNSMVLVVQASCYTKYLGNLTIFYDQNGNIVSYDGIPVFLGHHVPKDEEMLKELQPWKEVADKYGDTIIGSTKYDLENDQCHYDECSLGDFVTDAMVDYYVDMAEEGHWTYSSIALTNAGSLRTSIEAGNITFNDLLTAQPFENTIDVGEIEGKYIREALEFGCHDFVNGRSKLYTSLLQVSGLRMTVNYENNPCVTDIKVRCANCSEPTYGDLNLDKTYKIITPSFLTRGGDGFVMLSKNLKKLQIGPVDVDVYLKFIKKMSPIEELIDGRITVVKENERIKRHAEHYITN